MKKIPKIKDKNYNRNKAIALFLLSAINYYLLLGLFIIEGLSLVIGVILKFELLFAFL
jgi:uncharacterized membrane protein